MTSKLTSERNAAAAVQIAHSFVTTVLGAKDEHLVKHQAFQQLFSNDFMAFANSENCFAQEADAVLLMQSVGDELRLLSRFPVFREKTIVAIAGGFSSGKSSLLTSLFDDNSSVCLPIGIEPVTAIPTYIVSGDRSVITGFPAHGGSVQIDLALYGQMGHKFIESLGFDLRRILPFVALETPWAEDLEHLCLIDTPGYNPASLEGATGNDGTATAETLQQADAVLWVIGLDANGEVAESDVDYLSAFALQKPLGIVINKADLRPLSQVKAVMSKVAETLDFRGIEYIGISAYSSVDKQELMFEKSSLKSMLQTWNQPCSRQARLIADVRQVFNAYRDAFQKEVERRKAFGSLVAEQRLDLHELGIFDEVPNATESECADEANEGRISSIASLANLLEEKARNLEEGFIASEDRWRSSFSGTFSGTERRTKVATDLAKRLDDMTKDSDASMLLELICQANQIESNMVGALNGPW